MIHLKSDYLAAGGNRHPAAADWSDSGVLAFGSDRNIALWRPEVRAIMMHTFLIYHFCVDHHILTIDRMVSQGEFLTCSVVIQIL